jgi:outer membrane receptor for ferric coprogen and ferric-rhodotorulic acid
VTGTNYEVGLKRADFGGTLNTSLAAYYIKQINGAQLDASAPSTFDPGSGISCCYVASDKNISKGVDFEVNGALTPRWQIATGYTYNFNQYTPGPASAALGATAAPLVSRAPEHLFKLWTTYKLSGNDILDRLQVGFGARIQSATYVSGSVCDAKFNCNRFNFTQGGYAVFDGMLKYDFNDHTYAQLNVKNILDRTYYQTVGSVSSGNWYGVPRSFTFSMHAQF